MTQSARKVALKGLTTVLISVFCGYAGNIFIQYITAPAGARDTDILAEIKAAHPPIGFSIESKALYFTGLFFVFALFLLIVLPWRRQKHPDVHGSAHFATAPSLMRYAHVKEFSTYEGKRLPWPKPEWCECIEDDNFLVADGVELGITDNPHFKLRIPNRHAYSVAGSGSGKTYSIIWPNVMQLNGDYVILDPKAENFSVLAPFLLRAGYKISYLDLRGGVTMPYSMCYNPMHYVSGMTDISQLAEMFIENTTSPDARSSEPFFRNMEKIVYTCLLGYFYFFFAKNGHEEDCTLPEILDYLSLVKKQDNGIAALDLVFFGTLVEDGFMGFREWLTEKVCDGNADAARKRPEWAIITNYEGFISSSDSPETRASIVSSCYARLQDLANADVARVLSRDELGLDKMGDAGEKRALFLIVPDAGNQTFSFLSAMVLHQLFHTNMTKADNSSERHLAKPIMCYLDELANVGKIPNLPELASTLRSRWINLCLISQNFGQFEKLYGDKDAKTLYENCAITLMYGGIGPETAEKISKEIGDKTVWNTEVSVGHGASGHSSNVSEHAYRVPVISASELTNENFPVTDCLTHYRGTSWYRGIKNDPKKHRRWLKLQEALAEFDSQIQQGGYTSPVEAWHHLYNKSKGDNPQVQLEDECKQEMELVPMSAEYTVARSE